MFERYQRSTSQIACGLVFLGVMVFSMLPIQSHRWFGGDQWLAMPAPAWAQARAKVVQQIARTRIEPMPPGHFGSLMIESGGKKQLLQTRKLHVKVTLQGNVARTQVEQLFYNPTSRQTEGTYTFRLPYGAAISRLSMDVNGKMVEGELVERTKARAIYSSIVRKMKDPALLEWQGGNRFRTQIFPIPARGTKRIILAYDHILQGNGNGVEYAYHLARAGAGPLIGDFAFSLSLPGKPKVSISPYDATVRVQKKFTYASFKARQFRSRGHLIVKVQRSATRGILHAGKVGTKTYGLLALPLRFRGSGKAHKDRILIVDTSAGIGAKGLQKARDITAALIDSLPSDGRFALVVGDVAPKVFQKGLVSKANKAAALAFLGRQRPLGATDLQAQLLAGLKLAKGHTDVVYIGDGIPSLGQMDPALLVAAVKKSVGTRNIRVSAIGTGANPDMGLLGQLARNTAGRAMRLQAGQDLKRLATQLCEVLRQPQLSDVAFTVKGMGQLVRGRKGTLAAGESLLLAGEMSAPAIRVQVTGKINGKTPFAFKGVYEPANATTSTLAPAFWARWTIAALEQQGVKKRRIIKLSKRFGVMSRYTSFLVLENDKAFKKHQIARRKHNARHAPQGLDAVKLIRRTKVAAKGKRGDAIRRWMRPQRESRGAPGGVELDDSAVPSARPAPTMRGRAQGFGLRDNEPTLMKKRAFKRHKDALGGNRFYRRPVLSESALRAMIKKRPLVWHLRNQLVTLLEGKKQWRKALVAVRDWRRYAREDVRLIIREAKLRRKLGQEALSRRVLSEIVEFAPQAYAQRAAYAAQLERVGNVTAACRAYGQAVRLNPARRDTFKKMMALYRARRKQSEFRGIIRKCIVDAVSRLPVVRDVSMILFWDDAQADIDLHVHEPSGEEVSYRKRESKQGGTLYYDITNGFGPEIYVLGTGKKGRYRVTGVRYRASALRIKATLVVLRNAGSAKETRTTYRVVFQASRKRKPLSITSFRIK